MVARFILVLMTYSSWFIHALDAATFNNNPGTVSIHENEDSEKSLFTFTASCYVRSSCTESYSYSCQTCGFLRIRCSYKTCYGYRQVSCYYTYPCNTCTYSGNNRFFLSGETFYKRACTSPGCGPTCSAAYCNNAGESYLASITCRHTGYETDDSSSISFTVSITQNAAPTFYWFHGNQINVDTSSGVGAWVNRVVASDSDSDIDSGSIYYSLSSGVGTSYIFGNTLFTFNTDNGYVYVNSDLSTEFSYYYYLTACVYDRRRDEFCASLNITLNACYQTPTCDGQSNYVIQDTHGLYTGHGTTNTLYNMIYPQPDAHFPNFNNGWHQLNWAFTRNDFDNLNDPPVTINLYTGEIYLTKNLSIFPSWPSQDFTMIIQVSNPSASCYTTTCTISSRVWYTNWAIEIRSLPATTELHEDTDVFTLIHTFVLWDYNYHWEDNFTCIMDGVTSNTGVNEDNLFEVKQINSNQYAYNSWGIYKKACQQPDCGYLASSFLCPRDIGCMNHNETQEYVITVTCSDGYDSSDTDTLTFRPIQNRAPYYINLPKTITLDSDAIAHLDIVYSITYWDYENENLFYRYVYTEQSNNADPGFWLGTSWGNYDNSLGNISATVHLWNTTNATYTIYICGHERRNDICDTLTIKVNEYCGPSPSCSGTAVEITNEETVGSVLFEISSLVSGGSGTGRSYAIAYNHNYFAVDEASGRVTLNSALPAIFPNKTYSVSAYVYETEACEYAHCTNNVHVTAVNNPISITNLDASVSIHEDTKAASNWFTIDTSDTDSDDTASCSISSISPDESDPDHFYLQETITGSDVFQVYSKEDPAFTAGTLLYLVTIVCADNHGSSATGTLSVNIDENQPPILTNLANPTTVTVDPATQISGDVIYNVTTSDTENDAITFACTVASTDVPYECVSSTSVGYIRLRRNLDVVDDNGRTFLVQVCISDAKHVSAACGTLQTTMTSSRTHPFISNLPASVGIFENTVSGTSLFDIDFTDPDTGETHSFTLLSVTPSGSWSLFSLDTSSGLVSTSGTFDYESETTYSLEFLVQDNYLTATNTHFLIVSITNVNEAPTLTAGVTYLNLTESLLPGAAIQYFFSMTDPDVGDTHLFSISSGTYASAFSIDTADGVLTLVRTWDLENGDPSSTSLVVACTDAGGLSATVGVVMEFANVNDNTPTVTVTGSASTIQISDSTSIITDLLTVSCSDADIDNNNVCDFSILGGGVGAQFFVMETGSKRSIGSTATLRLQAPMTLNYNRTFTFTIKVSDGLDSDVLTVGVPVVITYTAPGTEPPTRPTTCTTCSSQGKLLIAFLCIEGVIIFGITAHLIWHFCLRNHKRSKEVRELQSVVFTKSRSRKTREQYPTPSVSDPQTASGSRPHSSPKNSRWSKQPVNAELFQASSLTRPLSSDAQVRRVESDSSSDSSDSSENEVHLPIRKTGSHAARGKPRIELQSLVHSNNASATGLPNPVYR